MNFTRFLKQKAVVFRQAAADAYGNTSYSSGVEVDCRWEQSGEQVFDASGVEVHTNHHILLIVDVTVGDLLWLGTLVAWEASSVTVPKEGEHGVIRVVKFDKTPDLQAKEYLREVWG